MLRCTHLLGKSICYMWEFDVIIKSVVSELDMENEKLHISIFNANSFPPIYTQENIGHFYCSTGEVTVKAPVGGF